MRYMGSKARIAREIIAVIPRKQGQVWVEPFCGAGGMLERVEGARIGNDSNPYLIALLKAVRDGWEPPAIVTREIYDHVKNNKDKHPPHLVAFVGFGCSFGGKWFGGYAENDVQTFNDYCGQSRRSLLRSASLLADVALRCGSYHDLAIPDGAVVYCDPPYAGTERYMRAFDSGAFWQWARDLSRTHAVYVSEYTAPNDFVCLWEKTTSEKSVRGSYATRTERLFKWRGSLL